LFLSSHIRAPAIFVCLVTYPCPCHFFCLVTYPCPCYFLFVSLHIRAPAISCLSRYISVPLPFHSLCFETHGQKFISCLTNH
jgi:hypothetical protein